MGSLYDTMFLLVTLNKAFEVNLNMDIPSNLLLIESNSLTTLPAVNLFEALSLPSNLNLYVTNASLVSTDSNTTDFSYLDLELSRRQRKYPHKTIDEIFDTMTSSGSEGLEMALKMGEDQDNLQVDYSNIYNHKGHEIDVTQLSHKDIFNLATQVDDIDKFEALEHIRSTYIGSSPNVKLYYAEPFLASPSFMHNDIGFLHILQYQFWLWFLFIFLIVFYFISFLSIIRWCGNRTQPRRETRGVSRSKCGDLITATVPVTWAVSIIVSESTDATDYYDGFGTGELIVGVRAYQWGWHYYYPKHADLNYNVKPSYSTFVGNSLKYGTSTSKKLNTNSLWKFYQSKADDTGVSPAHVLVLPADNSKILNLMNFKNIGIDNLQASKAFKQIRANSRTYTTNLTHNLSPISSKYNKLNSLFFNESKLINSTSFGLKRASTLTSTAASTSVNSTFLDTKSMNKFLDYNLSYNSSKSQTRLFNTAEELWSKKADSGLNSSSLNVFNVLFEGNKKYNSANLKLLALYPNVIKEMGDDSDKKSTNYPFRKLFKKSFTKSNQERLSGGTSLLNSTNFQDYTSAPQSYINTSINNIPKTSKEFMIQYSYQSQPFSKQSVRRYKNLNSYTTNYNLSSGLNTLDSNTTRNDLNNNYITPFYKYNLSKTNWSDLTIFNKLASNRVMYKDIAPILSNNPNLGRLSYDRTFSSNVKSYYNPQTPTRTWSDSQESYKDLNSNLSDLSTSNVEIQDWRKKRTSTVHLFAGDRTGEDRSSTAAYWESYWAGTNPDLRLSSLEKAGNMDKHYYLSLFVPYYDYDFRNAQGFRLFEDLVWESIYSGYSHQEYLNVYSKYREMYDPRFYKWSFTNTLFLKPDRSYNASMRFGTNAKVKDLSNIGSFYSNSIQSDDYFVPVYFMNKSDLSNISFVNDANLMDEAYADQKNLFQLYVGKSSTPLAAATTFNYPQSHNAVLNSFRSDYEDFSHFQDLSLLTSKSNLSSSGSEDLWNGLVLKKKSNVTLFDKSFSTESSSTALKVGASEQEVNPINFNTSRFSNPVALRRTAKGSMVTYQAFQKVFKLRYDEGRAHVRLTDFADSAIAQPYTTEQRIKYDRMLGKTRIKHFNTNFNTHTTLPILNDIAGLTNSLNYYFFEFPFLDGVTNDPTRHVWFDAYIKFAQREVGGSSTSKYTIVGVPFYKKKYDFNVKQGRQMADSELYFSRIATSRKNYIPQWIYTPYLYTRSNDWYKESKLALLSKRPYSDLVELRLNLKRSEWYWFQPRFSKNTSAMFTPSFSNSSKSFFQPYTSIQAYQYTLSTVTDILSRREYIYRQVLERRNKIVELPINLRSTPRNPLIAELKSSFLLVDPITYNAEYSRELYYSSLSYFKYIVFQDWLKYLNQSSTLPINLSLLNNYLFFYFLDSAGSDQLGDRSLLQKNQFKPLKKGISNMMRLQGSGAVAMPIEIRLQILASSKDVIHSWAIPSAGIKIDCIPGYTSHRIMIFFSPGIYWGQCQEICGRYHHWMPIIVYFMKRDLFFLWCTHFLSKKDPYATQLWEANDKQFADYLGLISYNKSSWLVELNSMV